MNREQMRRRAEAIIDALEIYYQQLESNRHIIQRHPHTIESDRAAMRNEIIYQIINPLEDEALEINDSLRVFNNITRDERIINPPVFEETEAEGEENIRP